MSQPIYHFEAAETEQAGHSLKAKVIAVYTLAGFIERRYRNGSQGEPIAYWAYVERGGKETGITSDTSAEDLQRRLIHLAGGPPPDQQQLNHFTQQIRSAKASDELDIDSQAWWLNRY